MNMMFVTKLALLANEALPHGEGSGSLLEHSYFAVLADERRHPRRDVKVGSLHRAHQMKETVDLGCTLRLYAHHWRDSCRYRRWSGFRFGR